MSNEPRGLTVDQPGWRVAVLSTILRTFAAFGALPALWSIGYSVSNHNYRLAANLLVAFTGLIWAAFSSRKTPTISAAVSVGILIGVGFTSIMSQGLTANVSALLTAACMLALLTLGPFAAGVAVAAGAAGLSAAAIAIRWFGWMPPVITETDGHALRTVLIFLGFGGGSVAAVHYIIKRLERTTADLSERTVALRRSEAEFRALFDHVFEGVFRTTREGGLLMANRAFAGMLGYASPEELLKLDLARDLYARPADRTELWERLERDGELRNAETTLKRKDGREIPISINARMVRDASGGLSYEGTVVDLTERHHLEEQLVQARKMEAVGRLAGGVAHDFNNLLTVILGYAELLHDSVSNPVDRHQVDSIAAAAGSAADLTRQLLAFSRKQILKPQTLDLNAIIDKTLGLLRRVLGENIAVETREAAPLDPVLADPGQLEQVIVNLCVNARDAMPDGGRLTVTTANVTLGAADASRLEGLAAGPHVLMTVADTGVGMDASLQTRIFEPFFSTKEPTKGTGLGLATVYGIVRQSGGSVAVQSRPGAGTTFSIYLPRAVSATIAAPPMAAAASRRGSETILVVEDDPNVRALMHAILAEYGYTVLEAASGLEALAVCERNPQLSLVLTDVIMPAMGGGDLAARLATTHPRIRVLMMSGYTDDTVRGVLESGRAILQKPFTRDDLLAAVRQVLDGTA